MVRLGRRDALGDGTLTPPEDFAHRVRDLLGQPGYVELLGAVRSRLEAGGAPDTVTLRELSLPARRALADLLGRPRLPAEGARVRVADLDAALSASRVGAGLIPILETLGGPLTDRRVARAADRAGRQALWDELGGHPAVAERVEIAVWLEGLRRDGLLTRLASDPDHARRLALDALAIIGRLPAGGIGLGVLAAQITGDPHALDHGQPLPTLVLRAASALTGQAGLPGNARHRRQLWADVGVACDPLSASVLVLGLQMDGAELVPVTVTDHAHLGEPLRLTLRQLTTGQWSPRSGRVLICENPAVVASAADHLEPPTVPLVCVEGMPDIAADYLLSRLHTAGCDLAFHGDFDWGGLRIGNLLSARYATRPWRFSTPDFHHALAIATATRPLALPRRVMTQTQAQSAERLTRNYPALNAMRKRRSRRSEHTANATPCGSLSGARCRPDRISKRHAT